MQVARLNLDSSTSADATIAAVVDHWASQLIDFSRRNNLLFFKDLKKGTLDLVDADETQRAKLFAGESVRASQLFPDSNAFQRARTRLVEIRRKIRLLTEERGIDAGFVAMGMLSWQAPQSGRPSTATRSPILLRSLNIQVKGVNSADFALSLDAVTELNPVLIYALSRQFGVDASDISHSIDAYGERSLDAVVELLQQRTAAEGVATSFEPKLVAGVFSYEKLPMVRDLEESTSLLASHTIVAALAGNPDARRVLQDRSDLPNLNLNLIMPEDEHLVLDADPSQQSAIAAVLAGSDLILQGPPGTGKSQTIANLIAEAAALGKKILFVAQKRAAIDAVVNNLRECDLAEIVLDLHDPKTSRKFVINQIKASMENASQEPPADVTDINRRLVERRERLLHHSQVMTTLRQPSGLSIEQMQQEILALPPESDLGVLFPKEVLYPLPRPIEELEDDLTEFVETDGLRLWRGQSAWTNARAITNQDELRSVQNQLDMLTGAGIRDARHALERLLRATGLPQPATLGKWRDVLGLMTGVARTIATYGPEMFEQDLNDRRAAFVATFSWRRAHEAFQAEFWRRSALRRATKALRAEPANDQTMLKELSAAVEQRDTWARLTGMQSPCLSPGIDDVVDRYERLLEDLASIGAITVIDGLAERPEPEMDNALRQLKEDERTLLVLPQLNQQRSRYEELGLSELLNRLAAHDCTPTKAAKSLRFAWLSSWIREMQIVVPEYASFSAATQERVINEFREADIEHFAAAACRVRRAVAERQTRARDAWPGQRQIVREQISRKARYKPIRQLVDEAPDLLLAVRPCWAMSPLVVSQVLPARQLFDIVVFDEASQIEPADAIPAIMRAARVVVAGDNKQLPPTPFFSTTNSGDDEELETEGALGDFESILDVLGTYVPSKTLTWHYRSRDERLIAFSNREIYGNKLVTFPATTRISPLRHVLVSDSAPPGTRDCGSAEARRVVELIIEHAEQRPDRSLGVIALGVGGSARISARLREMLMQRPDLATFFDEGAEVRRRFFVKNLENVQGDERDAIILSLGGSRTATGALNHNFGPINHEGGERRLNVAFTRARQSLVIVSTFSHQEFIEERLTSRGLRFLRDYLRFVAQQDSTLGASDSQSDSSPIEQRIIEQLQRAGIRSHPRYGISGSKIDIAVEHPDRSGRLLLAIEIDSDRYHSASSVRERDRLRPQQLEMMGWQYHRVWATEWLRDPCNQVVSLTTALESAVRSTGIDGQLDGRPAESHHDPQRVEPEVRAERTLPPPRGLVLGLPIEQHSRLFLVELTQWIDSDGLLRDEEEMIDLMMAELGYRRRGKNIVEVLRTAVRAAHGKNGW